MNKVILYIIKSLILQPENYLNHHLVSNHEIILFRLIPIRYSIYHIFIIKIPQVKIK